MKKTIYILLTLAIIFSLSYTRPVELEPSQPIGEGFRDAGLPPAAQTAWESTVQTRLVRIFKTKEHRRKEKVGSGVIVDLDPRRRKALIVTTLHNIKPKDAQSDLYRKIKILFPGEPGNRSQTETFYPSKKVFIIMTRPDKDLAYLSVKYPKKARPAIASFKSIDNDVTDPGNLIAIGFPYLGSYGNMNQGTSNSKKDERLIRRFSIGKFLFKTLYKNNVHLLAHSASIWDGNSGGPLVDNKGRVIGLNALIAYQNRISGKKTSFFYAAICVSEVLDDIEYINKNKLW
jgi:S1-C subfamily serine protease